MLQGRSAKMRKRSQSTPGNSGSRKNRISTGVWSAVFTAILALVVAITTYYVQRRQTKADEEAALFADDPHTYSIFMQGRLISGQSRNPFVRAPGYVARVEVCENFGVENISTIMSCLLTLKPSENLTISNSENLTTVHYEDGSVATICCMYVDDSFHAPLFRIALPRGSVKRRTYPRGEEIHIMLNVPNPDPRRTPDAISFSPGERAPPVLFPVRGSLRSQVVSSEFINRYRDDPRVQEVVREAVRMRDEQLSLDRANEGLTYPQ